MNENKICRKPNNPLPPCQSQSKFVTQFWVQSTRTQIRIFYFILFVERFVYLGGPTNYSLNYVSITQARNCQWAQPVGTAQQLHGKAGRILGKRGVT
jgi:hypothetical protein